MKKLLHLDSYYMNHFRMDCHNPGEPPPDLEENPLFDFDVFKNPEDDHQLALRMCVRALSETDKDGPTVEVRAEMLGLFTFKSEANEKEMGHLIYLNGSLILYGILRGVVTSISGNFPVGQILLPSVYMDEVLDGWQQRKNKGKAEVEAAAASKNTRLVTEKKERHPRPRKK